MKTCSLTVLIPLVLLSVSFATAQNSKEAERAISTEPQMLRLATFVNSEKLDWGPLKEGVNIYAKSDRYQWNVVPEPLGGVRFLLLPQHAGVLNFEVQSGGVVYIATSTRWDGGGNSSGGWKDEVLLEKNLRRKGWRRIQAFNELSSTDTGKMAVFYRNCEAGEKHTIRTEKYAAPMLLTRGD